MINEALKISLSFSEPDASIEALLEFIGKTLKCERAYIFEEKENNLFANIYEWCAKGVAPRKSELQNASLKGAKIWLERFRYNENVVIKKLEDIRYTVPFAYEYLISHAVHSLVVSPVFDGNKIVGFFGVDNPPKAYMEDISILFQIMGHFMSSLLRKRNLVKKLEMLSFCDQLTGFGNRHAMEHYFATMQPENSIGVISCDVMGLKKVNDSQGHKAGDKLLIRACECVKRVFTGDALFRMGGDEFVIFSAGVTLNDLSEKIGLLKNEMEKDDALMAVGYVWKPDSTADMDKLLAEADQRMYDDKRAYYRKNGIDRRKS
jgi:diguanylate cyclase (GGDEF)-like protein